MFVYVNAHARRRIDAILGAFQNSGATDLNHSKSMSELGLEDSPEFQRLADAGILREVSPGRWYIDRDAAADSAASWRRMAFIAAVVAAAAGAAAALFARH